MEFRAFLRIKTGNRFRTKTVDTSVKICAIDETHAKNLLNIHRDKIMKEIKHMEILNLEEQDFENR